MSTLAAVKAPLYLKLARSLDEQMSRGVLRPGDRLPSVRAFSRQQGVSISTVLEAYIWLENRGAIESRPKSGFFVRVPFAKSVPEPRFQTPAPKPASFGASSTVREVMRCADRAGNVPLGSALPDPQLLPNGQLNRILRSIIRRHPLHSSQYSFPPGNEDLRRQIARRSLAYGCSLSPSEIVITSGAMEALNLALRAVARPGEVIAVESPTYFGGLDAIQSLGMRAIEIPTHPREGMSLDFLETAIRKHRVKACLAITNGHNPLGYVLGDDYKKALAELTARHDVALIEDNLYGDLAYGPRPPKLAKSFDQKGNVLLCASISKVISPGLRLGWIHAGRYQAELERLKLNTTVATASLPQLVAAEYLESGGFDRYLVRLRIAFAEQVRMVSQAVAKYFPEGTRITRPGAGYLLWVELPKKIDALKLFRVALDANIGIVPGPIFSTTGRFSNCIRLSCGYRWSDTIDRALVTLGRACDEVGRQGISG
jgi:DNA-binding transcriptional MocR family regulator